jgi:broad specificity phosphatase PhoE
MNLKGLLQGQGGFGLLPEGRSDALAAARRLAGKAVDLVYSSDQLRARQSAAIVRRELKIRARVRTTRLLREFDFGRMTGMRTARVDRRWPEWRRDPAFRFPGGESYRLVQARALRWLGALERRRPARVVAVVTHGGWLRALLAALGGLPLEGCLTGHVPHGLVARIDVDGASRRLRVLGDVTFWPARSRGRRGRPAPRRV